MSKATGRAAPSGEPFVFLHVGDLHLSGADDRNACDVRAILAQISAIGPGTLFDFVYLPGDLAENGCASEYTVLAKALAAHPGLPVRLIPGDHDRQHGTMHDFQTFHAHVGAKPNPPVPHDLEQPPTGCPERWPVETIQHYYFAETHSDVLCLFVDMVSPGYGRKSIGLDFRLGFDQTQWLSKALVEAAANGTPCAVFMHAYPDDLRVLEERLDVAGLIWGTGVRLVEMGHTHYNELAHDGRTLYAAARSVGQNEDGSVGYAVVAIDGPVTSWRFRALDRQWPFVLITSPADRRLATVPHTPELCGMPREGSKQVTVRAVVLSDEPPDYVHCRVDTGPWVTMASAGGRTCEAVLPWLGDGRTIQVEAVHRLWPHHGPDYVDYDVIEPVFAFADPDGPMPPMPQNPGSDVFRIRAWPHKGVRGDQMGPNRNGRKW